jgi:formate dehydrogenase iron-sulfur subunit
MDAAIVAEVKDSGLRGRGGAGFPTGIKWETVRTAPGPRKYIVCNADEGDSGTFADRMLMEGDPFTLIEGMVIAGLGVGAEQGYVYLRSEYPDAIEVMERAIEIARAAGIWATCWARAGLRHGGSRGRGGLCLWRGNLASEFAGGQARRGARQAAASGAGGVLGRPTVVNNVISLATVPVIFEKGAAHYAGFGQGRSRGTMPFQIAGNVKFGGLFETAFGMPLGELVEDVCGGTASGRPVKAAQVGGPLGAYFGVAKFDTALGYEEFDGAGGLIGHAGVVVFDDTADMLGLRASRWSSAPSRAAGNARPAGSARCGVSRRSTGSRRATGRRRSFWSICARR